MPRLSLLAGLLSLTHIIHAINITEQAINQKRTLSLGVIVFPGWEPLDVFGPMEIFFSVCDARVFTNPPAVLSCKHFKLPMLTESIAFIPLQDQAFGHLQNSWARELHGSSLQHHWSRPTHRLWIPAQPYNHGQPLLRGCSAAGCAARPRRIRQCRLGAEKRHLDRGLYPPPV